MAARLSLWGAYLLFKSDFTALVGCAKYCIT